MSEATTTEEQRREWVEQQMCVQAPSDLLPPLLVPPLGEQTAQGVVKQKHSHYYKDVKHLTFIDVYRVLHLFNVSDPCLQHAIKKLLVAGGRGAGKDITQDVREAQDSLARFLEMRDEDSDEYAAK